MINPDIQENIAIKTKQAHECAAKALQLCNDYSRDQKQKHLKEMGGYLGTFVNNLRSALNYASVDYCEQRGFTKNRNGKPLSSTDFPYSLDEDKFKRIDLVSLMSQIDPDLYTFVERIQPYHPSEITRHTPSVVMASSEPDGSSKIIMSPAGDQKLDSQKNMNWLGSIMKISNMDKHNILVKPREMNINTFAVLDQGFFEPKHFGSAVIVGLLNGKPVFVQTPCYVPQIRMFALRNGKWLNFMITMDEKFLEFIPFMSNTANTVESMINKFYSLWN